MQDETNVAAQPAVETETTQTNSPQVESPITGDETIQGEHSVQTPVEEELSLPNDTEEQRRAFQEMRLENKRLKEEMEARPQAESAFDAFRQPQVGFNQPLSINQFTDPVTGETNLQAYQQAVITQAKAEARAEAQTTVQESLDEERARQKFPDLFSNPATEKAIAAQWFMDSKFAGKPVSILQTAAEFARNFKQSVSKAEKIGMEKALNEVSEKEKAGLTAQTQSPQQAARVQATENLEELRFKTQKGDGEAITARISAIPWANK